MQELIKERTECMQKSGTFLGLHTVGLKGETAQQRKKAIKRDWHIIVLWKSILCVVQTVHHKVYLNELNCTSRST